MLWLWQCPVLRGGLHPRKRCGRCEGLIGTDAWVQVVNDDVRVPGEWYRARRAWGLEVSERRKGQGEGEQGCSANEASSGADDSTGPRYATNRLVYTTRQLLHPASSRQPRAALLSLADTATARNPFPATQSFPSGERHCQLRRRVSWSSTTGSHASPRSRGFVFNALKIRRNGNSFGGRRV